MFSISRTSSYAILALGKLAAAEGPWTLAAEIREQTDIPAAYLSKILHQLGRRELINTKCGYRGGFALARPAREISLLEIVEAVEGPECINECMLGQAYCSDDHACPTHDFWKTERSRIRAVLAKLTLDDASKFVRQDSRGRARDPIKRGARRGGERVINTGKRKVRRG